MRERHNVYVIELDKDVLYEAKFKKANPDYVTGKPCVYVSMTGHDPDTRFDQHKAGIKSNKYAMKYGIRLMPEIYEQLNPMPYGDAQYMEVDLAIRLQQLGYGVWQNWVGRRIWATQLSSKSKQLAEPGKGFVTDQSTHLISSGC